MGFIHVLRHIPSMYGLQAIHTGRKQCPGMAIDWFSLGITANRYTSVCMYQPYTTSTLCSMLERRGALVDRKRYLKPASVDSQVSIYVFLCFELTRVDTYTEITYVHACTLYLLDMSSHTQCQNVHPLHVLPFLRQRSMQFPYYLPLG